MPGSISISFDRAAGFYDATRPLPGDVTRAVRDTLLDALGEQDPRLLEVGIGTGRIAWPFLDAGDSYVGVDLSRRMLAQLLARYPQATIVQADASVLPFGVGRFDGVLAIHVLHLVGAWERVVSEVRRVLKPGGVFAWSWHWRDPDSVNRRVRRWLSEEALRRGHSTERPGARSDEVQAELQRQNAVIDSIEVDRWQTRATTLRHELDRLANRITSDTWALPDNVLEASLAAVQQRALTYYGSPDYTEAIQERFVINLTAWPAC
jgi:ubiquinone/menaquinone biosynthesis C-methylase UbiE